MSGFPHLYRISLTGDDGPEGRLEAPPRPPLTGSAPPEFGGPAEHWSPEHLLLSAVALCHRTTFQALAKRKGLAYKGYRAEAEADLDKTPEGLRFTAFRLKASVRSADPAAAKTLLEAAEKHCLVSRALNVKVQFEGTAQPL